VQVNPAASPRTNRPRDVAMRSSERAVNVPKGRSKGADQVVALETATISCSTLRLTETNYQSTTSFFHFSFLQRAPVSINGCRQCARLVQNARVGAGQYKPARASRSRGPGANTVALVETIKALTAETPAIDPAAVHVDLMLAPHAGNRADGARRATYEM